MAFQPHWDRPNLVAAVSGCPTVDSCVFDLRGGHFLFLTGRRAIICNRSHKFYWASWRLLDRPTHACAAIGGPSDAYRSRHRDWYAVVEDESYACCCALYYGADRRL